MQHNTFISSFKKILWIFVFLLAFTSAFRYMQNVMKQKHVNNYESTISGFYAEKKNSMDMIMLGSSNSFCTINPLILYKDYGITSYNLASSSQTMNISLLYLKEALKKQNPKVVALEVNYLVNTTIDNVKDTNIRWGLEDIPFSIAKVQCLNQCVSQKDGTYFSYLFPVFFYHNRWKELTKIDYQLPLLDKTDYAKGYNSSKQIYETPIDLSQYNSEGECWVDELILGYFDEIIDLCHKNDISVILYKSPRADWHADQTQEIEKIAEDRNLIYIDYNRLIDEVGIDVAKDFRDATHLNDNGATKVTEHFGKIVEENFQLQDHRNEQQENNWDKALAYEQRKMVSFDSCNNASEFFNLVNQEKDYAIIVTYLGDAANQIQAHQWVYKNQKLILDKVWTDNGSTEISLGKHELVLHYQNGLTQVLIGNLNYEVMSTPWSVIVYDMITGEVIENRKF